jgi:hypothetical protein
MCQMSQKVVSHEAAAVYPLLSILNIANLFNCLVKQTDRRSLSDFTGRFCSVLLPRPQWLVFAWQGLGFLIPAGGRSWSSPSG